MEPLKVSPDDVVTATTNARGRDRQPRLDDVHPLLRGRIRTLATRHQRLYPDRMLCLIWAYRSLEEQREEFRKGFSGIDGDDEFGMHNYLPTLAADLWVYLDGEAKDHVLTEGRPPKEDGAELKLFGKVWPYYEAVGKLGRELGLEWGGDWLMRDGPHFQLSKQDRIVCLQVALLENGIAPGPIDGIFGRLTRGALEKASEKFGVDHTVTRKQERVMPCHPALWAKLHGTRP